MSFAEFTSNKNKGVLWGLLQEGGVFDNIPASMFQNVKNIFQYIVLILQI
jgi:type III secretion system FlhB-like substrate exporter